MKPNEFSEFQNNMNFGELREKILRLSVEQFLIKGYKNVNLDNISKELRISKRTIYNIFTSKKHLFSECCLTIFLGLTDIAVPILNNTNLTPFEKITKIIRTFIPQISRIPPSFLNDMRLYTPALYQDFLSFREFMLLRYQGIIKSAQKAGFVRNDINTEILTDILLLSANNILIPEYLMAKNISPSEGLGHILKIIFLGILSEDARIQIKEI